MRHQNRNYRERLLKESKEEALISKYILQFSVIEEEFLDIYEAFNSTGLHDGIVRGYKNAFNKYENAVNIDLKLYRKDMSFYTGEISKENTKKYIKYAKIFSRQVTAGFDLNFEFYEVGFGIFESAAMISKNSRELNRVIKHTYTKNLLGDKAKIIARGIKEFDLTD